MTAFVRVAVVIVVGALKCKKRPLTPPFSTFIKKTFLLLRFFTQKCADIVHKCLFYCKTF